MQFRKDNQLFLSISSNFSTTLRLMYRVFLVLFLSQKYFECLAPFLFREELPGHWHADLDGFQKLLVLRCIRADKVTNAMQDFVAVNLGQRFIEPQTADLSQVFKDSSPTTPLIFVLSPGTDPASALYKFSEEMRFSKKLNAISLGQGQGPRAEALMHSAMERGKWVFFQNCHLAPSWMPTLERLTENIDPDKVNSLMFCILESAVTSAK